MSELREIGHTKVVQLKSTRLYAENTIVFTEMLLNNQIKLEYTGGLTGFYNSRELTL